MPRVIIEHPDGRQYGVQLEAFFGHYQALGFRVARQLYETDLAGVLGDPASQVPDMAPTAPDGPGAAEQGSVATDTTPAPNGAATPAAQLPAAPAATAGVPPPPAPAVVLAAVEKEAGQPYPTSFIAYPEPPVATVALPAEDPDAVG